MSKRIDVLTTSVIENSPPKNKQYKLSDGGGLYLLVTPSGRKLWRMNYRFNYKQKTIYLKNFPELSIEDAQKSRQEARQLLVDGVDPGEVRRQLSVIEKTERLSTLVTNHRQPSVRIDMEGVFEIWKGRSYIKLSRAEAIFIKNQISKLVD
jgi:hypothetical protein